MVSGDFPRTATTILFFVNNMVYESWYICLYFVPCTVTMDISISRQVLSIHSISVIHCLYFKKRIVVYFINLVQYFCRRWSTSMYRGWTFRVLYGRKRRNDNGVCFNDVRVKLEAYLFHLNNLNNIWRRSIKYCPASNIDIVCSYKL